MASTPPLTPRSYPNRTAGPGRGNVHALRSGQEGEREHADGMTTQWRRRDCRRKKSTRAAPRRAGSGAVGSSPRAPSAGWPLPARPLRAGCCRQAALPAGLPSARRHSRPPLAAVMATSTTTRVRPPWYAAARPAAPIATGPPPAILRVAAASLLCTGLLAVKTGAAFASSAEFSVARAWTEVPVVSGEFRVA